MIHMFYEISDGVIHGTKPPQYDLSELEASDLPVTTAPNAQPFLETSHFSTLSQNQKQIAHSLLFLIEPLLLLN